MIKMDFKQLVKKLNSYATSALEGALGSCMSATHYEITFNHFLLKLLERKDAELALLLTAQAVDLDKLILSLQRELSLLPKGNTTKPSFAPNLFEILEAAWLMASINLNLSKISSGALLLALIEYARGHHCWEMLAVLNLETLQKEFFMLTSNSTEREINESVPIVEASVLAKFCQDLTAEARASKIDPVYGRDYEVRQMIDVLCRRRKNNPILVGEAGVGKTALVEGLALKISHGQVPELLRKVRLLVLDLGALEAGASVKGELENRIKMLLQEIQSAAVPIILFIDEAHLMMGSGGHDVANLLKPALARGQIRVIAATTWSEYKKYIEKDPALTRRFQLIKVNEPDAAQTLMILRGLRKVYEASHQVVIRDDALQKAVSLSMRYIPDRQQPDKAIDLLDTAAARVKVNLAAQPARLEYLVWQIATLEREQEGLLRDLNHGLAVDSARLAEIKITLVAHEAAYKKLQQQWQKELALVEQILKARADCGQNTKQQAKCLGLTQKLKKLQGDVPLVAYEVDPDGVAEVVSDWTKIPLGKVLRDETSSLLLLAAQLKKRIQGQDEAIVAISEQLQLAKSGLKDPRQPMGVFLLVGPSGVGKTETALTVADTLFGGEESLITINMSEFQERHSISRLIGSPPGYVGYGEGGRLTEAVRKRPYSVILLDEVEKASLDVLNLFYQVFDKGVLTDGEGRTVDFSQTVIFLTSNLATELITELCVHTPDISLAQLLKQILPSLNQWFRPALLARMQVLPYKNLSTICLPNDSAYG